MMKRYDYLLIVIAYVIIYMLFSSVEHKDQPITKESMYKLFDTSGDIFLLPIDN